MFFFRLCIPSLLLPFYLPLTHSSSWLPIKTALGEERFSLLFFSSSAAANTQKKDNKNRFFSFSFSTHSFTHSLTLDSMERIEKASAWREKERHKSMYHEKKTRPWWAMSYLEIIVIGVKMPNERMWSLCQIFFILAGIL